MNLHSGAGQPGPNHCFGPQWVSLAALRFSASDLFTTNGVHAALQAQSSADCGELAYFVEVQSSAFLHGNLDSIASISTPPSDSLLTVCPSYPGAAGGGGGGVFSG